MRVYVESNFVLEIVYEQEELDSCERILELADSKSIELVVPSIALVEPAVTLDNRTRERTDLQDRLHATVRQIGRTKTFGAVSPNLLTELLVRSNEHAALRYKDVIARILPASRVLTLDAETIVRSSSVRDRYGLKRFDSLVLASVLLDLEIAPSPSCFISRDSDFSEDAEIVQELGDRECKVIQNFVNGVRYIEKLTSTHKSS